MGAPGPAVIKVVLDTAAAQRALEALEDRRRRALGEGSAAPGSQGAQVPQDALPPAARARTGSDAGGHSGAEQDRAARDRRARQERDRETERQLDAGREALTRARRLGRSALTGGLAQEAESAAQALASEIPGGATAFRTALIAEKYGPAVAAAFEEALPEEVRPVTRAASQAARGFAQGVGSLRARLSAVDTTREQLTSIARLQARGGGFNSGQLAATARALYDVNRTLDEWATHKRIQGDEAVGRAIGKLFEGGLR
jgi:hypothetical protein